MTKDIFEKIKRNENLNCLIKFFKSKGHQLFLVGGTVRDILLDNESSDIDLSTSAIPDQMLCWGELDKKCKAKVVNTGSKFGTVTFVFDNKESFEVTTFREDVTNGRHPEVKYADNIFMDLSRRDLTINSMAINLMKDNIDIIDPFLGREDIENNKIKFVGSQIDRINEDPLRILRALRIASKLNFEISDEVIKIISENFKLLKEVSNERILGEIIKASKSNGFGRFVELMQRTNLFVIINDTFNIMQETDQNKFHAWNVFRHTLTAINSAESINKCHLTHIITKFENKDVFRGILPDESIVKIALLFHDTGKPSCKHFKNGEVKFSKHEKASAEFTASFLKEFKCSKSFINKIVFLVRNHMMFKEEDLNLNKVILRFLRKNNLDIFNNNEDMKLFLELVFVIHADSNSLGTEFERIDAGFKILNSIVEIFNSNKNETNLINIDNIALNGNDIIDILNIKPGPKVGIVKKFILEKIIDNPELNNFEDLSKIVKEFKF